MKKHFGAIKQSGTRVIVVFRHLPDDPSQCLVVEENTIPERYHDAVINLANSPDAQRAECNDFYEVLNRNIFSDGTNMLQTMHFKSLLRKVAVESVVLIPFAGRELPLAMANTAIDGEGVNEISKDLPQTTDIKHRHDPSIVEDEPEIANDQSFDMGNPVAIAEGLLLEAEMMQVTAKRKMEEAYALAPELKPVTTGKRGRPPKSDSQKTVVKEAAKERRNAKERAQRAEAKKQKEAAAISEAVDAKVVRDAESVNK